MNYCRDIYVVLKEREPILYTHAMRKHRYSFTNVKLETYEKDYNLQNN